ncbi:hypothetical protein HMPREF9442_02476 [Paraprevotella xylaniphila YIT 11841]|uniref:Uncharacterized protein n=2 Tax=Paraprevotella xylaniphila TaxID=454155 RepID=F3QW93_9BACT|nr:hypothetical protein HMPREF9442_02476 [Paraprevotella xylaniphila YIT 11841]
MFWIFCMDKVTNKIRHSQLFYYQLISLFLHKSFPKNILHLSGCMLIDSLFVRYGLKDVSAILQPRFISFGRERKTNLRRMKNRLA